MKTDALRQYSNNTRLVLTRLDFAYQVILSVFKGGGGQKLERF